jgi:ABC-type lipoprotein release transport system permease subunit
MHNDVMGMALYTWRVAWRRSWQMALTVALIGGLLGAVAMAAVAGARRTDSAYGRYLQAAKASDLMIDIPGPVLSIVHAVENLPGKVSAAAYLGLNGQPVINGKVDPSFQTDGIAVSLDGEYFRQDKVTVLAGKLPALGSTSQMAVTQPMAQAFHLHAGSRMTWQFQSMKVNAQGFPLPGPDDNGIPGATHTATFVVTAIAAQPPALGDTFDDIDGAILPPAAAAQFLAGPGNPWVEWSFAWVAMRLRGGDAGVKAMQQELGGLSASLARQYRQLGGPITFNIRRLAIVKHEAQQAIEPQAVALAILGAMIALAMLVLVGQGLTQLVSRSAADGSVLRAMGATRGETAISLAGPGVVAIAGSIVLSVVGAIALSPLAPVGEVRAFDPQRGVQADWLVLGGGAAALLIVLGGALAFLSWRAARQRASSAATRPLALIATSRRSGLPISALTGMRYALERGYGRQRAPVRATLAGSVVAVTALAVSLVFITSLTGLINDPARYGWDWTTLVQSQGGWGTFPPDTMAEIMHQQPGIAGWSEFGFSQLLIDHQEVPVLGLQRQSGSVQPPTTSGHALTTARQIELGSVTMRQLGVHVGERVTVGTAKRPVIQTMTVVGVVTLPSMGTVLTDHVSLGRGAMLEDSALLSVQGLPPFTQATVATDGGLSSPSYPSAVAIDTTSAVAARRAVASIVRAEPDRTPGGMYFLYPQQGAQVVDLHQMGALPISIALGVALAAVLALALTIVASVRQRRRELALLKSVGMRRSQLRAVVASQTSTVLAIAVLIGIPLGIAAGRWAWTAFAQEIGVVPAPVLPAAKIALGVLALLVVGNLLATWPAAIAARTSVARVLRSE